MTPDPPLLVGVFSALICAPAASRVVRDFNSMGANASPVTRMVTTAGITFSSIGANEPTIATEVRAQLADTDSLRHKQRHRHCNDCEPTPAPRSHPTGSFHRLHARMTQ